MKSAPQRLCLLALVLTTLTAVASAQTNYSTHSHLAALLRSKPFEPAVRDAILESLERSMPLYAFLPLNHDSALGAPEGAEIYRVQQDTMAALRDMASREFDSAYDMDEAFNRVFLPLLDAHTAYRKPYTGYAFSLPLRLQAREVDGKQGIYLSTNADTDAIYAQVYGESYLDNVRDPATGDRVTLDSIDGLELTHIAGKPARRYLWDLANAGADSSFQVGVSKEAHTRFNLLVHGFTADPAGAPGYFVYRNQRSFGIPEEPSVSLTFRHPTEPERLLVVQVQWIGMSPSELPNEAHNGLHASLEARVSERLRAQPVLERQELERLDWQMHSLQHPAAYEQRRALLGAAAGPRPSLRAEEPVTVDTIRASFAAGLNEAEISGQVSFRVLEDNTGVLRINTFNPSALPPYLELIQKAVTNHQNKLKGTKLIIDLRANGGGDICLGYAVLRFLFPQITQPSAGPHAATAPFGRYDILASSTLAQELADFGAAKQASLDKPGQGEESCQFFTPCAWVNPESQTSYGDDSWFRSERELNRGGQTERYSALFHDQCADYFLMLAPTAVNRGYDAKNVLMLSDGTCGSTCAVFSSYVQIKRLAKTVALGGFHPPSEEEAEGVLAGMQFSSFAGGQVASLDYFHEIVADYGILSNDTRVPQRYPNGATQSFTIRQIYHWEDSEGVYPMEFLRIPSHFHFPYTTEFTDAEGIYADVLRRDLFGDERCVTGVTDLACEVDNGVGERECSGGVIGECKAINCDAGYELQDGACTICAAGFYSTQPAAGEIAQCTECPVSTTLDLPDDASVECSPSFTTPGWTNNECPYVVKCVSTVQPGPEPEPAGPSGRVSKTLFFAVVGGLACFTIMLLIAVCILRRKLRARAVTGLDDALGFSRMYGQ